MHAPQSHEARSVPLPAGAATVALLAPTAALLRGFELDAPAGDGSRASAAPAKGDALVGTQLREGFHIGELGLMIRYEDGNELIDLPTVYRLPNAPDWFVGVANLHGALVPVFDLARYCGVEHDGKAKPMLLVLAHGAAAAGVLIDGLPARLRFDPAERSEDAPVPRALEGCIAATYWLAEHTWMDLQVDDLLAKLNDELTAAGR